MTPDGGLAWVLGNTRAADTAAAPDAESHRTMFVYERVADQWRLVVWQRSAPFR